MRIKDMKKRIVSTLLAVMMITALLAGCQTKAAVVKRGEGSKRGTAFHAEF